VTRLEQRLGIAFRDKALALRALTHKSSGEGAQPVADNQRLEFLGDAVLQLAVSSLLYRLPGELPEGDLTKYRAHLVNGETLGRLAEELDVPRYVRAGRGLTNGSPSVAADCLEALLGALFLDQSYAVVQRLVERLFGPRLEQALATGTAPCDAKSRLQHVALARWNDLPHYVLLECTGDNPTFFHVRVQVGPCHSATGTGPSKKAAEQSAARNLLESLQPSHDDE